MVSAGCGACVMEVSSHALALRRADGIHFAAGVFTNLTRDHLDFHANMEDYFAAKRRLFEMLPADAPAVVNVDDPRGAAMAEAASAPVTYAVNQPADVTPGPLSFSFAGLEFDARTPRGIVHVRSTLVGRPNVYNILARRRRDDGARRPARRDRARPRRRSPACPAASSAPRLRTTTSPSSSTTRIPTTRCAICWRWRGRSRSRRLITVFGAGGDRDRTKRPLMGMVAARLSDVVVITSDNPRSEDPARIIDEVNRGAQPETRQRDAEVADDRRSPRGDPARRRAGATPGDVVLIAGKGHEKYQEIGGVTLPFDDVAVAREALEARRLRSRVG